MTANQELKVTASELSARLGAVLDQVERGARVSVTRNGTLVAVIMPAAADGGEDASGVVAREAATGYGSPVPALALGRLMGNASQRAVLAVFLRDPGCETYQREISRRSGIGLRSAQIALDSLERLGLIRSRRDGNRKYYSAIESESFETLRAALAREVGFTEVIGRHLSAAGLPIEWAFVFGSAASAEDAVGSDIDLLVVGEVIDDALVAPVAAAQRELGKEIDPVVYRPAEFARRRAEGNHFISSVLARPRIDVIGGDVGA